jgi:hypothetical protein
MFDSCIVIGKLDAGAGRLQMNTPERTRAQMWAESSLAPHPHRLELRGSPGALSWPEMCAHCGEPATQRITVRKVFRPLPRRHGRGRSGGFRAYRIHAAAIPFCAKCIAIHEQTVRRPSIATQALHLIVNPLIIPVAGFAWMMTIFWRDFRTSPVGEPGRFPEWAIVAGLGAALAWCVYILWESTARTRLESQTEITRSCDFSEDVSGFLEKERRIYAIRNKPFADRMAALNADRVWTAGDQTRSRTFQFAIAVLMLAALSAIAGYVKLTGQ